ncbi:MAG TPA: UPF0182 family protein [Syntrophomonadaceae bacterium]|nr:UPF0182 family protein [Syntrophomonadaceae bacterium]
MQKFYDVRGPIGRLFVLLVAFGVFSIFAGYYTDWLWFRSVNYQNVFTTILYNKMSTYAAVFLFTFLLFYLNLQLTRRHMSDSGRPRRTEEGRDIIYLEQQFSVWRDFLEGPRARWIFLLISLIAAFLISSVSSGEWLTVQQFLKRVSVGISDPLFHRDLGFYFFNLGFYQFVYQTLMSSLVLLIITVCVVYGVGASASLIGGNWKSYSLPKGHIGILLVVFFLLKAWGYWLNFFEILYSPSGVIYGAGYTQIYADLVAYKAMLVISLAIAVIIVINLFSKRIKWILYAVGVWLVVAVVMQGLYPSIVQKLVVQPDEFNKEKPYIENAIKFTRQAYNLDQAASKEFNISFDLNIDDPANRTTLDNIRLWDWQPLKTTYQNLQQLRSYYVFDDVDIDRYTVDNKYRQIMLSAREIDQSELPAQAQTWINQRLMYTHGYGVVASPVNEIAQEGFPNFFIKDIPPRSSTSLVVTRPEIYFGERTSSYVIVNSKQQEFDYPAGDQNKYTTYQGKNGIPVGSFGRRLMFSWILKDYKMLISSEVDANSQVLMNRNVKSRIQKIAPYLRYDNDPYIVIAPDGRLYWMLDAYTYANRYPYSQPYDQYGNNYIRNSVKVVCDAYTGEMNFYMADASDPLIQVYSKIFPGLYKPLDQMPEGLKPHIRYPEDMFSVQAGMFSTFHMTDPYVFYNKEDAWVIPTQTTGDKQAAMTPYYLLLRLPGDSNPEYMLMLPFTPKGRLNMVSWMGVRMDGNNYGKMLVYTFPKQETVFGPQQIDARLNQDTTISQQLTLWSQSGSKVYRGGLLVVPLNTSILYIEPLYLQAENSQMPELKRVIVGYGDRIVMEANLTDALVSLFGKGANQPAQPPAPQGTGTQTSSVKDLVKLARQYYDQANQALKDGNWASYGENLSKLNGVLSQLEQTAK